jgi:hypothetical protein
MLRRHGRFRRQSADHRDRLPALLPVLLTVLPSAPDAATALRYATTRSGSRHVFPVMTCVGEVCRTRELPTPSRIAQCRDYSAGDGIWLCPPSQFSRCRESAGWRRASAASNRHSASPLIAPFFGRIGLNVTGLLSIVGGHFREGQCASVDGGCLSFRRSRR